MALLSRLFGTSDHAKRAPEEGPDASLTPEQLVALRDDRIEIGKDLKYKWAKDSYPPCPPEAANPFPDLTGEIPAIDAADIDIDVLSGAIRHHGALIVRGLMDQAEATELRGDIDRVLQGELEGSRSDEERAWFSVPHNTPNMVLDVIYAQRCNSVFTFTSPLVSNRLLGFFERISLRSILRAYFNEEPCVSFKKSVLRRMEPTPGVSEWHQDGAFMTEDIASLNVWIALTECGPGTGAPGMKFVPKRLSGVLDATGKNGAALDWTVSQKTVDEQFTGDATEVSPHFNAGDAIFFDHLNLHATATGPEFKDTRYAIETWFFASSRHAKNQISVAWT